MKNNYNVSGNGPAFKGWQLYQAFAESVKSELRYVKHNGVNKFLEDVLDTCTERKLTIPQGTLYWRARLGHDWETISSGEGAMQVSWDEKRAYSVEKMKPVANWQNEGRVNSRGIPYLYLSTTRDTALAEVRPWLGSMISVAQFEMLRELNLIDCSKHHSMDKTLSLVGNMTSRHQEGIWMAVL